MTSAGSPTKASELPEGIEAAIGPPIEKTSVIAEAPSGPVEPFAPTIPGSPSGPAGRSEAGPSSTESGSDPFLMSLPVIEWSLMSLPVISLAAPATPTESEHHDQGAEHQRDS